MTETQSNSTVVSDEEAVKRLNFEAVARQVFDAFLVLQPDVPTEGLFRLGQTAVPIVSLLLPYLLTKANEDAIRESPALGSVLDWANGNAAGVAPEAVLLARMRKRVTGMHVRHDD
jgi:hypothetical protein